MTSSGNSISIPDERLWYEANCHCGAVKYKVRIPSLDHHEVNICNCSICTKNGYELVYPLREDVVFHQGYETLANYLCSTKTKDHKFCPKCASSILIDFRGDFLGKDILAVNVRMFKDIEPEKLKHRYFDGKNLVGEKYEV